MPSLDACQNLVFHFHVLSFLLSYSVFLYFVYDFIFNNNNDNNIYYNTHFSRVRRAISPQVFLTDRQCRLIAVGATGKVGHTGATGASAHVPNATSRPPPPCQGPRGDART